MTASGLLVLKKVGAATIVATAIAAAFALPAQALPVSNGTADTLTFVGSDTTQFFDDAFCAAINANSKGDNPSPTTGKKDTCVNVHALAVAGETTKVAPADSLAP